MPAKKIPTNGPLAETARIRTGQYMADIAVAAEVTERIVRDIEASIGATMPKIMCVAPHILLTYHELIDLSIDAKTFQFKDIAKVKLPGHYEIIYATPETLPAILRNFELNGRIISPIIVLDVRKSSILLTLLINREDIVSLISAFGDGKIDARELISVTIPRHAMYERAIAAYRPFRLGVFLTFTLCGLAIILFIAIFIVLSDMLSDISLPFQYLIRLLSPLLLLPFWGILRFYSYANRPAPFTLSRSHNTVTLHPVAKSYLDYDEHPLF
jgi:hypothetical protein